MLRTVLKRSVRLYSTTTNSTSLRVSAKEVAPTVAQAPNRATTWSENQRAKHVAMSGPRFEQMTLEAQPNAMAAIDLIAEEPIRMSTKRVVACDGGGGPLGHPKVYINLDKPGAHPCGYCGVRFQLEHHH